MSLGLRIKQLREKLGISQSTMADKLNVATSTYQYYERGERGIPSDIILKIITTYGVTPNWLYGLDDIENIPSVAQQQDDFIHVPLLSDVKASAGDGYFVNMEQASRTISFRRDWIIRHDISANHLSAIHVSGDSMYPTLINGDLLLVDSSQTQPQPDRIFVVRTEDGVVVKRSGGLNGAKLLLISDNPRINDREIDLNRESVGIIGRVVWCGRNM